LPPPLGNPDLWIPACGAWLGAEVTNSSTANFSALESEIGRQLDVLRIYHTPGSWTHLTTEELNYINAGRKLLESVKPSNDWTNAIGAANGGSATVDAQMASLAQSIASIKPMKIMLIVFHEPQNNVTGSVPGADSGTPATYVAMWHNVRSIFDANGATNVIWCWDVQDYPPLRYLTSSLWPGNNYVDWVMWDEYQSSSSQQFTNVLANGYNWFTTNSTPATNYLSKPWGVAEWGVGINSYYPTLADQTNGINEMNDALNKNNQFPKIKLAAYYDDLASTLLPGAFSSYSNFANSPYMMQQCSP
jgi:Glycosyl hydrolase family 26